MDQGGTQGDFWIAVIVFVLDLGAGYTGICFLIVKLYLCTSAIFGVRGLLVKALYQLLGL